MTTQHRADWACRLDAIARMRNRGASWKIVAQFYGVKESTIHNVRKRFQAALLEKMAEAEKATVGVRADMRPVVEPEIFVEDGIEVKRYPPLWAEDAVVERYTAKPKGRK
jgi:hypothetical protein